MADSRFATLASEEARQSEASRRSRTQTDADKTYQDFMRNATDTQKLKYDAIKGQKNARAKKMALMERVIAENKLSNVKANAQDRARTVKRERKRGTYRSKPQMLEAEGWLVDPVTAERIVMKLIAFAEKHGPLSHLLAL